MIERDPIRWGLTLCSRKLCDRDAEAAFEGVPFCLAHAEEAWERQVARELLGAQRAAELLGDLEPTDQVFL